MKERDMEREGKNNWCEKESDIKILREK